MPRNTIVFTQEMVDNLNKELLNKGCHFEYILVDSTCIAREILDDSGFVCRSIISCTKEFQDWIVNFFKQNYDIPITHGSSGTISFINTDNT